ncbi:MAG: molybdopterin-dependent oxidoreductase [Flavobacteriaceae bacterium]|nr:molybdopterin-dependent oxidoreductase [Flavobacteriaceae bacterium]
MARWLLFMLMFGAAVWSSSAYADDSERQLLIKSDRGTTVTLSLSDLKSMPQLSIETSTPWTEGKVIFSGPSLKEVIRKAGLDAKELVLMAKNEYAVEIQSEELRDDRPIVAWEMNSELLSLRGKGPYWIIYPFDQLGADRKIHYAKSIWQLIEIKAGS